MVQQMTSREDEIQQIAYRLWEEEGRPANRSIDHYLMAEQTWEREHDSQSANGTATAVATKNGTAKKTGVRRASTAPRRGAGTKAQ